MAAIRPRCPARRPRRSGARAAGGGGHARGRGPTRASTGWSTPAMPALLGFVPVIDRTIVVGDAAGASLPAVLRALRRERYDVAVDSAGPDQVGGDGAALRGPRRRRVRDGASCASAPPASSTPRRVAADNDGHVIRKNLSVAAALGASGDAIELPLRVARLASRGGAQAGARSCTGRRVRDDQPRRRLAEQAVARRIASARSPPIFVTRHGLRSTVTWGPSERALAEAVARASSGAAAGRARH